MGKGFKALIFGGAVGAALGVLYAPRDGKKTRAMLAKKTDALWGPKAQEQGTILGEVAKTTKTAVEAGQNIFNEAQKGRFGDFTRQATDMGQKWFKGTSAVVGDFTSENVRPVFAEKNDELRRKIDKAREKIAAQVSQNISQDAAKATTPAKKPAATKTAVKATATKAPAKKAAPKKKVVKKTSTKKSTTAKKPAAKKNAAKKI